MTSKAQLWSLAAAFVVSLSGGRAATIVIDDFEAGKGRFNLAPSFSGTTQGETESAPGVGPSTTEHDLTLAISGSGSLRVVLDDDPNFDVAGTNPVLAWRLRLLSGGGTPGNNLSLVSDGFVGFYLQTTTPDLLAGILIDDGAALERSVFIPIIADGNWHLYQWSFDNTDDWEPFAGSDPNGAIDAPTVTIDGLFIAALKTSGDQDGIFNIDYVAANPEGMIEPVPEPSAGLLLLAGALVGAVRRPRQ